MRLQQFLLWFCCMYFCTAQDTGSTPCFDVKADIVFVVDESGSVQREDHQQLLYFMDKVTQALDVGLDQVRVGAMSFSGEPRLWFYLNRYDNKTDMLDRIMRERYTQGGSTYTDRGLLMMKDAMFNLTNGDRPDVPNIGIIITDGQSTNGVNNTAAAARLARQAGILLIVVGIGQQGEEEYRLIGGDRVLSLQDYSQLVDSVDELLNMSCFVPACNRKRDIIFIIDTSSNMGASNFTQVLDVVTNVTRSLEIGDNKTRVGVMAMTESSRAVIHLSHHNNGPSLLAAIRGIDYNGGAPEPLGSALNYMNDVMFQPVNGDRSDVPNFAFVITASDVNASDSDVTAATKESLRASEDGVRLYFVKVGSRKENDEILREIASGSDQLLTAKDSQELAQTASLVQQQVCQEVEYPEEETCEQVFINMVGLAVAIGILAMILLSFIMFRKLRQGKSQGTLFCVTLTAMLSWVVCLAGVTRSDNYVVCLSVSALLHYLILASFMWMLTEAVLLCAKAITPVQNYLSKTAVVTWVLPAAPVIVVLVIDRHSYVAGPCCWMSLDLFPFYYAFLAPLGFIVFATVVVDVVAFLVGCCCGGDGGGNKSGEVLWSVFCLAALGVSWLMAYLSMTEDDLDYVFSYIFTIAAPLHATVLFLIFVARDPNVRPRGGVASGSDGAVTDGE